MKSETVIMQKGKLRVAGLNKDLISFDILLHTTTVSQVKVETLK